MKAIYKRELKSYFNSMIGYIFIAFFVAFMGFYFMAYNLYNGYPYFFIYIECDDYHNADRSAHTDDEKFCRRQKDKDRPAAFDGAGQCDADCFWESI